MSNINESKENNTSTTQNTRHVDFIRAIINQDVASNKYGGKVVTRFPPEPNGFLHIGHAKAICIDFGIAEEYGGVCNLRMDDTDPTKEDYKYVNSIQEDVKWLGFDWQDNLFFASDYYQMLYDYAEKLVRMGKAYVCSLNEEEIRAYRGTVTTPGKESPYRNRTIEENLLLFTQMKNGEFKDGAHVLRAKIDMASPNMKMRDPLLYRIRHAHHYRTEDKWCIYPMYDFAHCLSDYAEGVTHSICTLEFENNRELYDWVLENLDLEGPLPKQYEFARLNLNYTVMSKRKLLALVEGNHVKGWDDPRMPTITGLRRRGYTPQAIRNFCESIGIAKANSTVDFAQLEFHIRDDLNPKVPRVLAVMNPLKVTITNYPTDKAEMLEGALYPHDVPLEGFREIPFSKTLYIERDDFMENPPKKYYRLSPGNEVRLRHAYFIKCDEVVKDSNGEIVELLCSYDPETKSGSDTTGRKVKGTIHWVSAEHAQKAEIRVYDRLFNEENPSGDPDSINPESLKVFSDALIEPSVVKNYKPGDRFQFERHGYFYYEPEDSTQERPVFNRIVSLKDSWTKLSSSSEEKSTSIKEKSPTKDLKQPDPKVSKPSTEAMCPDVKERYTAFHETMGITPDEAALIAKDSVISTFFMDANNTFNNPKAVANLLVNELLPSIKEESFANIKITPKNFAELVQLLDEKVINAKIAKQILEEMLLSGENPSEIIAKKDLKQITDSTVLEPIVDDVIAKNPATVEKYKSGKTNLIGFFVGQVMKETKGKADATVVNKLVQEKLS